MGKYSELESKDLKEQTQSLILELAIYTRISNR